MKKDPLNTNLYVYNGLFSIIIVIRRINVILFSNGHFFIKYFLDMNKKNANTTHDRINNTKIFNNNKNIT